MTSQDPVRDDERITSRSWVAEYKKEHGNAPLGAASRSVFTEGSGASEDSVAIPSVDPALHLASSRMNTLDTSSSSRMNTLDAFRLASFGSGRIGSIGSHQPSSGSFDWLKVMGEAASKAQNADPSERVSTVDYLAKTVLGEDEPKLSPEHESGENAEPAASTASMEVASKPVAAATFSKKNGARQYVEEAEVHDNDILSERGGRANHHYGNKRYRKVVSDMKAQYRGIEAKTAKTDLSRTIVAYVKNYGGRFLKKGKDGRRYVMTDAEARKKTSQALRETKQLKWTQVDVEDHVAV